MGKRTGIYYWKCDRPSAFFAIDKPAVSNTLEQIEIQLRSLLEKYFGDTYFTLKQGSGQGNHLTFLARHTEGTYFLRIENGPDEDDYMEVEAEIMRRVRNLGIPTPKIFAVDASRKEYPFAYQIMEHLAFRDLNELYRAGDLNLSAILIQLGKDMALWQSIPIEGYGPFDVDGLRTDRCLKGLHADYPSYFGLNLENHLNYLVDHDFFSAQYAGSLWSVIEKHLPLLNLPKPCLVHKDMALWNLLGDSDRIQSYIDWDDAVAGDPCDDIALMGCFFSGAELEPLIRGYSYVQPLPAEFELRFWLHLLRNMIFKAVIRVGAGYFNRDSNFFLLGSVQQQESLEQITKNKIEMARMGLLQHLPLTTLL